MGRHTVAPRGAPPYAEPTGANQVGIGVYIFQPVYQFGPDGLKAYAMRGEREYAEAEAELRRRWDSYKNLPKTEFVSILPPRPEAG